MARKQSFRTSYFWASLVMLLAALLIAPPLAATPGYAAPVAIDNVTAPSACAGTFTATDTPKNINDNSTIVSNIDVSNGPVTTNLKVVHLKLHHSGASDLTISLTDPTNTTITLFSHVCDFGLQQAPKDPDSRCNPGLGIDFDCPRDWSDGVDFNLADNALQQMGDICPPAIGDSYIPQDALSVYNGKLATGRWKLTVNDDDPLGTGTLDGWSLQIAGPCPAATATATRTPVPTATPVPCTIHFSDVQPTDFFYEPVRYLYCAGIISGYTDGTFRPFNNTTRSQLAKIVVGAQGWQNNTSGGPHFSDVPVNNPFYQVVETAYHHGVISGYNTASVCAPDPTPCFKPFNNITRGQLSKVVVTAQGWALINPATPHFTDVPRTNTFYKEIETAVQHGIISGYTDHTFRWNLNATRGQIAKIVYAAQSTSAAK